MNFYLKISQVHGLVPKSNQVLPIQEHNQELFPPFHLVITVSRFPQGVYCKTKFYLDSKDLQTATIPLSSKTASLDFNYSHLIKIYLVTQQFLTYLADQPLVIEVWRTQHIKEEEKKEAVNDSVKGKEEDTRSLRSYIHSVSTTSTKDWMAMETMRRGSAVAISRGVLNTVSGRFNHINKHTNWPSPHSLAEEG